MRQKDYDLQHRNYYLDHPTSVNHTQPYITSLQNQYSILSRARNPYQVLDHINYQLKVKEQQPTVYIKSTKTQIPNESLVQEMRQWNKRQNQKQNSFRTLKDEMSDLSKIIKVKEAESQLDKLRVQLRNNSNKSSVIPYPMLIPFGGMGYQLPTMSNSCSCYCNCNCRCQATTYQQLTPTKTYRPVGTADQQIQTLSSIKLPPTEPSITKLPPSQPKIKTPKSLHLNSLSSLKSEPKIQPRQVMRLQKKKKSGLLRRFRICAYAVYFCIYFKWFSFQLTINRYNRFKDKYLMDAGRKITEAYKQVYEKMLNINIPQLIRSAAKNVPLDKKKSEIDISTLIKQQAIIKLNTVTSYKILANNSQTLFLRCAQFLTLMFKELQYTFSNWQWDELGQALGVGALNKSFLIDNYFLPHEIYLMVIHDGKGYAQITRQHQRSQVMVKFIVKILLFNVCLQLDNNRQWLEKNGKELEEDGDEAQIFVLLQISSKILFIICQYLYEEVLSDSQPNYDEVSQRFKIEPCNPLVYSHSIRRRRQLFKDENIKDSNLLIYGIENLDEVNKIMRQDFFKSSNDKITYAIHSFIDLIRGKLHDKNKEVYSQLWEQTLNNEYIVLRGIKKIMKSSRFFPFVSNKVIGKRNVKTDLSEFQSEGSKSVLKINRNNKNGSRLDVSNVGSKVSLKEAPIASNSNISKISIKNTLNK